MRHILLAIFATIGIYATLHWLLGVAGRAYQRTKAEAAPKPGGPPFCKDCRHYDPGRLMNLNLCRRAAFDGQDPVDAKPVSYGNLLCDAERSDTGGCGPSGKLFEEKSAPSASEAVDRLIRETGA